MGNTYNGIPIIDDETTDSALLHPPGFGKGLEMPPKVLGRQYQGTADAFPQNLLIPKSEVQARVEERKAAKRTLQALCDWRKIPPKNQGATNYCTTEDTEVLTENGWVLWPRYNGSDLLGTMNPSTGFLEFQEPLALQVFEHDGPVIYSTHRSANFAVTPNHRMLVRKWDERHRTLANRYTFQRAEDLGWYFGLPPATTGFVGTDLRRVAVDGDREYDGDDFLALIALVVSDGYAGGTEKTRSWVSFACFNESRRSEAQALASRIGFHECPSRPGVFVRYDAWALAEWMRTNAYTSPELGSQNKKIPDLVKCASARQIGHFLARYGDQSHNRRNHYFSTSKRVTDDIQELLLRVGIRGSIWTEERSDKIGQLEDGKVITSRRAMHHVHARQTNRLSIDRKENLITEHYRGQVYCATVPNSTLITRRNGNILISGNCWVNSPTYAVEVVRLVQNQKMILLSPASAGAQIKHYQNEGGWGKEALQWISDRGLVPVDQWPANAIDPKFATDENLRLAKNYRCTEWWELSTDGMQEIWSCLLLDIPVCVGLSWWRHEVTYIDVDWIDGDIAIVFRNSWGTSYGNNGYSVLQGQRMYPDDAVAPRQAVAS